jgi:alkyl hydroperoxide reductase subunit AhpC
MFVVTSSARAGSRASTADSMAFIDNPAEISQIVMYDRTVAKGADRDEHMVDAAEARKDLRGTASSGAAWVPAQKVVETPSLLLETWATWDMMDKASRGDFATKGPIV